MAIDTRAAESDVTAAQELEGLIALDHRQDMAVIKRVERFKALKEQIDALEKQKKDLRDELLKDITDHGAEALMLDGSVIARRSVVTTTSIDGKALQAKHPRIYAAFLRTTQSVRFTPGK